MFFPEVPQDYNGTLQEPKCGDQSGIERTGILRSPLWFNRSSTKLSPNLLLVSQCRGDHILLTDVLNILNPEIQFLI